MYDGISNDPKIEWYRETSPQWHLSMGDVFLGTSYKLSTFWTLQTKDKISATVSVRYIEVSLHAFSKEVPREYS